MPMYLSRPVNNREQWRRYAADFLDPNTPGREVFTVEKDGVMIESYPGADNFEDVRRMLIESKLPVQLDNFCSLYGSMRNRLGLELLSCALYDDEAWVQEMIE